MSVFLAVFLTLYASMNTYLFWRARLAFPNMGRFQYVLAGLLLLLAAAPVVVRLVDRAEHPRLAGALGVIAHSWMAIIFWFCCLGLLLDLWNLGARGVGHWAPAARKAVLAPRPAIELIAVVALAATLVAIHEARDIRLTQLTVRTDRLSPGSPPIRVVQISDLHLGGGTPDGRLGNVLKLVEDARPDVLVSTGDLVDSPYENLREYAEQFARVQAPLGKFGVPGNHEYYVGLGEARRFHEAAGFRFLRGESVDVSDRLRLACADDPTGPFVQTSAMPDPLEAGQEANRPFVLLLKHRPAVRDDSLGRFDLQLSGHTHGGQIFPFNLFVRMFYRYDRGLFALEKGSQLYVSRGTGTWGPPMRLGSPPEVTLITVEPAGG